MTLQPTPSLYPLPSRARVHVRNLQTTVIAARDAWARTGKSQPLSISTSIGLGSSFSTSSATDKVDTSTVHYGQLSKAILASLEVHNPYDQPISEGGNSGGTTTTLASLLVRVWSHLTGLSVSGTQSNLPPEETPFLTITALSSLSLTLMLPKASLLGSGVSITATSLFGLPAAAPGLVSGFGICLAIRGLRIPVLVGVNANERLARQVVIADVEIERFDFEGDVYVEIEGRVVKAMESSSFETLEALGTHLAEEVMSFVPPNTNLSGRELGWQVKISLEKPIAIPMAEGPIVEIIVG